MKILVTGNSGFIGGTFGRYAAHSGHRVMGTGRSPQPGNWPGEYARVEITADRISQIVRDFAPDVLLHAVGTASVGGSMKKPLDDLNASALTWANVLEGVRRSGRRPIMIFPSSAAVYGNPPSLPINEDSPIQPISPYGFHKAITELLAREYAKCYDLDLIVCRFFSVFGSAQRRLLVWELYNQLVGSESTVWIDGTGSESRDFLYIDDVVSALLALIEQRHQNRSDFDEFSILNVGRGEETDVSTLAKHLRDLVAPEKEIRCRGNVRKNDPVRWRADVSRLKTVLPGWRPRTLSEGLSECVTAWQQGERLTQHGS